jgi:hypothetical protein
MVFAEALWREFAMEQVVVIWVLLPEVVDGRPQQTWVGSWVALG